MNHTTGTGPSTRSTGSWLLATEIEHVRATFAILARDPDRTAGVFYQRLFELDPSLRRHFPRDMASQREKLMLTLSHAVAYLDDVSRLSEEIKALGRRHREYGARELDYTTVGDALLFALEQLLGNAWSAVAEHAWEKTYTILSQTMLRAARGVEA